MRQTHHGKGGGGGWESIHVCKQRVITQGLGGCRAGKRSENIVGVWQSTFFLECILVIIYESVLMFECIWLHDAKKDVKTMIMYISGWFNVFYLLHWINLLSAVIHFVILVPAKETREVHQSATLCCQFGPPILCSKGMIPLSLKR